MSEQKFKVGELVKVIANDSSYKELDKWVGCIGFVLGHNGNNVYYLSFPLYDDGHVKLDSNGATELQFYTQELEKVPPIIEEDEKPDFSSATNEDYIARQERYQKFSEFSKQNPRD